MKHPPRLVRISAVLVVATAALLGSTHFWPSAGAPEVPGPLGLTLQAGQSYMYHMEYAGDHHVRPLAGVQERMVDSEQVFSSALSLDADLEIHCFEETAIGDYLVSWSITACHAADYSIADQQVWSNSDDCERAMVGHRWLGTLQKNGRWRDIVADAEVDALSDQISRFLIAQLELTIEPASDWAVDEPDHLGTAQSAYRRTNDGFTFNRTRDRYGEFHATALWGSEPESQVQGRHTFQVSPSGELASVVGNQRVRVLDATGAPAIDAQTRVDVTLVERLAKTLPKPEWDLSRARPLVDRTPSRELDESLLRQQADGLSFAQIEKTISDYGEARKIPDAARFMWRATAVLKLEPERAWGLTTAFTEGGVRTRSLVLDLLASAGHSEAQNVMRALLDDDGLAQERHFESWYQRLGLLEEPTDETAAFVRERFEREQTASQALDPRDTEGRNGLYASMYTLGAVAGNVGENGSSHADVIADVLLESETEHDRDHAIRALSNAKRAADVPLIAGYADDSSPVVRTAVAAALASPRKPEGLEALLRLASDGDRLVQNQALRELRHFDLEAGDFDVLTSITVNGGLKADNHRIALELAKHFRGRRRESTGRWLRAMLDVGIPEARLRAAALTLLTR